MQSTYARSLPYQFEFNRDDLVGIVACNRVHGFAVVKALLPNELVEQLKDEVRQITGVYGDGTPGKTYITLNFIEEAPRFASLLTYQPYMRIAYALQDNQPLTLNRSAAIYKMPGSSVGAWHTDWEPLQSPYTPDAVLNNTGAVSTWFYLTGTHPERAGLAIIPDSHTVDWAGPDGFVLTADRKSFYKEGTEPHYATEMDFAEVFPLITDPGDMILFAERTYHGVFPHHGNEVRLSCAMSFRRSVPQLPACWPVPESARRFIASVPAEVQPLVADYRGIDLHWRGDVPSRV